MGDSRRGIHHRNGMPFHARCDVVGFHRSPFPVMNHGATIGQSLRDEERATMEDAPREKTIRRMVSAGAGPFVAEPRPTVAPSFMTGASRRGRRDGVVATGAS
jgi:hypothetical protein